MAVGDLYGELRRAKPAFGGPEGAAPANLRIGFDALRWLFDHVVEGSRTLETGCGYSTVAFAAKGAHHTVISPLAAEQERVAAWCRARGVPLDRVTFRTERSEDALPRLADDPLDLVLIDGNHAFPWPFLDWFFTADKLRVGGRVLVDDTQLRTGRVLRDFLAAERGRWTQVAEFERAALFEKVASDVRGWRWWQQPWTAAPEGRGLLARLVGRPARRPTLALAVIARDEEAGLPRAIASVRDYVHEIVVAVDARTTDRTREVAAEAGARVVEVAFEDFAQMRAAAVAAVTADWVLMLDGDETLEGDPRPLLARRVIWEMPRRHWENLARTRPAPLDALYPDRQRRLFPNDPRLRFERPVHEVAKGLRVKRTTAVVIHHYKEALRPPAVLEARRRAYAELKERGLREGWRYRDTD